MRPQAPGRDISAISAIVVKSDDAQLPPGTPARRRAVAPTRATA